MISACMPLSRKYSAMAHPEYGAKNCSGAGSEAVAATITVYSSAPFSASSFTSCATVERFCPTATYTQYSFLLSSVPPFTSFWLMMASIAMAVFPVWRSPMMSSRWPRPMGTRLSTALSPVCMGSCTDLRTMIPGALISTRRCVTPGSAPLPSIGTPRPSTTRPRSPRPTGTSTMDPVRFTMSPSLMVVSLPKHTIPTLSFSKFSAIPFTPLANSTISPDWILFRPYTRAMPSPTESTRPISSMFSSL
mmetsp:Transcript_37348/g.92350  ORF Transcript_37348/g.92350 Transcript_37348/m.92350 type:complete len:248 (+) Transcript_37348:1150-1893(+)